MLEMYYNMTISWLYSQHLLDCQYSIPVSTYLHCAPLGPPGTTAGPCVLRCKDDPWSRVDPSRPIRGGLGGGSANGSAAVPGHVIAGALVTRRWQPPLPPPVSGHSTCHMPHTYTQPGRNMNYLNIIKVKINVLFLEWFDNNMIEYVWLLYVFAYFFAFFIFMNHI